MKRVFYLITALLIVFAGCNQASSKKNYDEAGSYINDGNEKQGR